MAAPFATHRTGSATPSRVIARICRPFVTALLVATLAATSALGQPTGLLTAPRLPLVSLEGFEPASNWKIAGGIGGDPRGSKILEAVAGTGVLMNIPSKTEHAALRSTWQHGDLEFDLEFLLPAESNSGIYLQGRYEVQLYDSWRVRRPKFSDCGGIYEQWDASRPEGQRGHSGVAPLANACRAPGLWQRLHVEFRAPRFDSAGRKIGNARFLKIALNGFVIHENVEIAGVTRGSMFPQEGELGPLVIQGDHGPVALRNIAIKRFGLEQVSLDNLSLQFYSGNFWSTSAYDKVTPTRTAAVAEFTDAVTSSDGRGAAVFTGTLIAPADGEYAFEARGVLSAALAINGEPVIRPNPGGRNFGRVTLKAGSHTFRIDQPQGSQRNLERFALWCEGPGIAPHLIGSKAEPKPRAAKILPVEPIDRILVQRAFTRVGHEKRVYTAAVGTPAAIHFYYDLEAATVLRVWRGAFLNADTLWNGRGEDQVGEAMGPSLDVGAKPLLALFAPGETVWPAHAAQTAKSLGYSVEPTGQPVFRYEHLGVGLEDRVAPLADGSGLTRTLRFSGRPWERTMSVLIAESDSISPQPTGAGYIVGDREYYIDLPATARLQPVIRTNEHGTQLVVSLPTNAETHEITYNLAW